MCNSHQVPSTTGLEIGTFEIWTQGSPAAGKGQAGIGLGLGSQNFERTEIRLALGRSLVGVEMVEIGEV